MRHVSRTAVSCYHSFQQSVCFSRNTNNESSPGSTVYSPHLLPGSDISSGPSAGSPVARPGVTLPGGGIETPTGRASRDRDAVIDGISSSSMTRDLSTNPSRNLLQLREGTSSASTEMPLYSRATGTQLLPANDSAARGGRSTLADLVNGSTRVASQTNETPADNMATVASTESHPRINESGLLHYYRTAERPKFLGSSSSQVFIKWFDQEQPGQRFTSHFAPAAEAVEEVSFPGLEVAYGALPDSHILSYYVKAYFTNVHAYYPILDPAQFSAYFPANSAQPARDEEGASAPAGNPRRAEPEGVLRILMYLVVSLGADSCSGQRGTSSVGNEFFQLAWQSLPTLLGAVNRSSAQALLLLAVACRSVSCIRHLRARRQAACKFSDRGAAKRVRRETRMAKPGTYAVTQVSR